MANDIIKILRPVLIHCAQSHGRTGLVAAVLPAGVGKATARLGIKLWLGARPENAGVFSDWNGPAMRAAIFGAPIDDVPRMLEFVHASSRLPPRYPKAELGAVAVALAAKHSRECEFIDANLWIDQVVDAVATPPPVNRIAVVLRNLFFLAIVLFHGFRRLAPPY